MGFLQISICIIFMIIYLSVLSLLQIVDLKRAKRNIRLLFHMGKNRSELKKLICMQALIKLFIPTLMSFIILCSATPLVNYKMNSIFPVHNHLLKAIGCFMVYFFIHFVFTTLLIYNFQIPFNADEIDLIYQFEEQGKGSLSKIC